MARYGARLRELREKLAAKHFRLLKRKSVVRQVCMDMIRQNWCYFQIL